MFNDRDILVEDDHLQHAPNRLGGTHQSRQGRHLSSNDSHHEMNTPGVGQGRGRLTGSASNPREPRTELWQGNYKEAAIFLDVSHVYMINLGLSIERGVSSFSFCFFRRALTMTSSPTTPVPAKICQRI